MSELSLTLPDGSIREYDASITGAEVADSISKSLAKKAVAFSLWTGPCMTFPIRSAARVLSRS